MSDRTEQIFSDYEALKAEILGPIPEKSDPNYGRKMAGYRVGEVNLGCRLSDFESCLKDLKHARVTGEGYRIPPLIRDYVRQIYTGVNDTTKIILGYNGAPATNVVKGQYRRFIERYHEIFERVVTADINNGNIGGDGLIFAAALGAAKHRKLTQA